MKKQMAIGSAIALAFGLAACTPPADSEGEAAGDEAMEATDEADGSMDGAMMDGEMMDGEMMDGEMMDGEMMEGADAAEGEGDGSSGVDQDGNPVQN